MASPDSSEHTTSSLSSQAAAISQLFDDANTTLSKYKQTRSPSDAKRFEEILTEIDGNWQRLKASWMREKPEVALDPIQGWPRWRHLEIHETSALEGMRRFKSNFDRGTVERSRDVVYYPEQIVAEMRQMFTANFAD
jgi:hypothetical protein